MDRSTNVATSIVGSSNQMVDVLVTSPDGRKILLPIPSYNSSSSFVVPYNTLLQWIVKRLWEQRPPPPPPIRQQQEQPCQHGVIVSESNLLHGRHHRHCRHYAVEDVKWSRLRREIYLLHCGKVLTEARWQHLLETTAAAAADCDHDEEEQQQYTAFPLLLNLQFRIVGGMDRQNRVGSKFGGGGVSSAQQSERERKERLKQLALESIDLAKDPYLVRNHLGTYECKLCLTLHRDEANYLAHTQGKKHQAGLARRAHLDKLKAEREGMATEQPDASTTTTAPDATSTVTAAPRKIKIGRPAYQVFKSREAETNQRCLSFELQYPEIEEGLQPRHRFMSAFEQKVESPPDRRYQYLLFAAEPYETVAFKIPNEPIDRGESRFVTFWDQDNKKFIVTLYFLNPTNSTSEENSTREEKTSAAT